MLFTLRLLVAKWPCQNSVSFSRSGSGSYSMRYSHHALSRSASPRVEHALAQAVEDALLVGGQGAWPEVAVHAGARPVLHVARQVGSCGPEAGAAVQVRRLGRVPGVIVGGPVRCPTGHLSASWRLLSVSHSRRGPRGLLANKRLPRPPPAHIFLAAAALLCACRRTSAAANTAEAAIPEVVRLARLGGELAQLLAVGVAVRRCRGSGRAPSVGRP